MTQDDGVSVFGGRSLDGVRVFFFGKLGSMNRREAKALVEQTGGFVSDRFDETVERVVVGADEIALDSEFDLLDEAILHAADRGVVEIVSETQFYQDLGLLDHEPNSGQLYTAAMLADLLSVPMATIRRWHRRGLIHPVRQIKKLAYFDFQEVSSARRIARLIESGASAETIERKLSRLAKLYPDLQRPLSQLSIIVEGKDVLLRNERGLVEPGGQLRLNFDEAAQDVAQPAIRIHQRMDKGGSWDDMEFADIGNSNQTLDMRALERLVAPEEFLQLAIECEDRLEIDSAIEVYRAMSLAFGPSADVSFRVAELLYQSNDLAGARERYYLAVEMDETFVEARASLGCVLTELGQSELAFSAFTGALAHHPDYPDVHFHLARLLDEMGREIEAQHHWNRFLQLAPKSPWAAEARQRLDDLY